MSKSVVVNTLGLLTACLVAGYGVLFTLLDEYRDDYGISESKLSLVIGIGFMAGFVTQTFIATFADRGHAKRLVLIGMALNVIGLLVMASATEFVPLSIGRLITGVGAGSAVPAVRRIVILLDPENVGSNLGRLLSLDVAGFAAGPLVAAVLAEPFGVSAPFIFVAGLTAVFTPLVLRVPVDEGERSDANAARFSFDLLRIRPFAGAVVLGAGFYAMIGAFDALWAVALTDLDAPDALISVGITLFALPLIVLAPVGGRLAQRVGPFRLSTLGLILGAVAMAGYGLAPTAWILFGVSMGHALSDGLTISATGIAASLTVPEDRQAAAQGVLGGAQTLAAGLMAPVAGYVYEHEGRTAAYLVAASVMAVLAVFARTLIAEHWTLTGPLPQPVGVAMPSRVGRRRWVGPRNAE